MLILLLARQRSVSVPAMVLFGLWMVHYLLRDIAYPWKFIRSPRRMPVVIVVFGALFGLVNAYLNGRWLFALGPGYPGEWLFDIRFAAGVLLFVAGLAVNQWADGVLRRTRREAGGEYAVPSGGLYYWTGCPNYLGEILEWAGWALAAWSLPALSFALWTFANLAPRAAAHRRWYRERFPDYPRARKRLVPFVW
jgi:protein-S-isoprenylcysteine O-methyltransferase Ste14